MPFFKTHPVQESQPVQEPPRKSSMFSRRRSPSPEPVQPNNTSRGFFSRRRSTDDSSLAHSSNNSGRLGRGNSVRSGGGSTRSGGGFFAPSLSVHHDPSIIAAREKVRSAENAEAAADKALLQARAMVREAKEHVRILEREAAEDAKRAKAKQAEATLMSKTAGNLGRHGV
ncbi:hypothetical protein C8J57DRAFT_597802 [Mycena rebaudengoi]|nr:hypothetical protein C8J57DRAFT_597802 [Mycena rebaudengoi]